MRKILKKFSLCICLIGIISLTFSNFAYAAEEKKYDEKLNSIQEKDDSKLKISLEEFLKKKKLKRTLRTKKKLKETKETLFNGLEVINTEFDWNDKAEFERGNKPKKLILHHIEASRLNETIPVTDIHDWHKANGWAGIGYHFYVTKTGKVYRGRDEDVIGAHALKNNIDTIGISVEGRYQLETMPQKQKDVVIKLGQYLRQKYDINEIARHKDVNSTDCPGKNYPFNEIKNSINSISLVSDTKLDTINIGASVNSDGKWSKKIYNSDVVGTVGKSKQIEGINLSLDNNKNISLKYRVHVEDEGWLPWVTSGNTGKKGKRLEAIEIKLNGPLANEYKIQYRGHVQDKGWLPWTDNNKILGTVGKSKRLEAFQIRVIKKNEIGLTYKTHVEEYGWQESKVDNQISGTTGEDKRLEAINLNLYNNKEKLGLTYRTHVQNNGWMSWVNNGKNSGTIGEAKRIEAIQIKLTGKYESLYKIEYSVYIQDKGWSNWMSDGQVAGTTGQAKRIEGIKIRLKRL